jgi:hypothetical protein
VKAVMAQIQPEWTCLAYHVAQNRIRFSQVTQPALDVHIQSHDCPEV